MSLERQITNAFKVIRRTVPDAISAGTVYRISNQYDASQSKNVKVKTDEFPVECVFERSDSGVNLSDTVATNVTRLHVFGYLPEAIDFYHILEVNGTEYKVDNLRQIPIGNVVALHTFELTR